MANPDFLERNPTFVTTAAHKLPEVRRAMYKFKKANRVCAWCGGKTNLDVHHVIPVSVAPSMAGEAVNMLMLCRKNDCHRIIGHGGSFLNKYVVNVRELCTLRYIATTTRGKQ